MSKASHRVAHLTVRVQNGSLLALSEAASLFGVSEMTIRRDIAGSDGKLTILGGHVISVAEPEAPYRIDTERDTHLDAKIAACAHALPLIRRDDTVFIDSGTTTCHIAAHLPSDLNLTVVCFSMNVAAILSRKPAIRWILTGGHYENATASFSGPHGPAVLRDIRVNKAFVSAGGVHAKLGVSCANFSEVGMKRAVIASAAESHLVIDSSKIGKVKAAFFADCSEFRSILAEHGRLSTAALGAPKPDAKAERTSGRRA